MENARVARTVAGEVTAIRDSMALVYLDAALRNLVHDWRWKNGWC